MAINNLYICSNIYNAVSTEEHCGPPEDAIGDKVFTITPVSF